MSLIAVRKLFRQLDGIFAEGVAEVARSGQPVTCTEGCDSCCYDRTFATQPEADLIVDRVAQKGRAAVVELQEATRRAMIATGRPGSPDYDKKVACPLLVGRRCSVYAERPMNCRGHFVATPATNCATRAPIQLLVFDAAHDVYLETVKALVPHKDLPWMDLNLALLKSAIQWLAEHPEGE